MNSFIDWLNGRSTLFIFVLSFIMLMLSWQALIMLGNYPRFILPGPLDVWRQFVIVMKDGRLPKHTAVTFSEVVPGLLIGATISLPMGYLLAKSPLAKRVISPYLIASQAIPIIAIAPLLTIWIQSTYWARVVVAVLVVFFPILINVIAGLHSISSESRALMDALGATPLQIFNKLEMPAASPMILAGLKIGATLSVIGALVGEFVQPKSTGLGYLLVTARYQFKTDLLFVVLITLGVMAMGLYGGVSLLEKQLLQWEKVT